MDALLTLDQVSMGHRRGGCELLALCRVSLAAHAGELFAVWGARGAGKTTLLKIAGGLEPPDDGVVRLVGRDLASLPSRELPRGIAWTRNRAPRHQAQQMLDYVAEPLRMDSSWREARRRARVALARTGASDYAGECWYDLHDEARALVAIARAVATRPKLLIADNPTMRMDETQAESVMLMLRDIAGEDGTGILVAVPDLHTTRHAHQVAMLSAGHLVPQPKDPDDYGGKLIAFSARARRRPVCGGHPISPIA